MNLEFVDRVIKTSLIISILAALFLSVYVSFPFSLSFILGCFWGCANLFLIRMLVTRLIVSEPRKNIKMILAILVVKFPLLYFAGYLLIKWSYLSVYGLLWGFTVIFIVTLLKVASRAIFKLDSKPAKVI